VAQSRRFSPNNTSPTQNAVSRPRGRHRARAAVREAPYTLDFALFHGERKLDIEVDGENYHRNWDGELCRRDQIRSRRLADLGWDILRFWVYEIRDGLEGSVRRVQAWMDRA
jgi:very-short-patch-repair endonuclease